MSTLPKSYITPEQYLRNRPRGRAQERILRRRDVRDGGAPEAHNLIVVEPNHRLGQQLAGRAVSGYPSDLRVRISATGQYAYPGRDGRLRQTTVPG